MGSISEKQPVIKLSINNNKATKKSLSLSQQNSYIKLGCHKVHICKHNW